MLFVAPFYKYGEWPETVLHFEQTKSGTFVIGVFEKFAKFWRKNSIQIKSFQR